MFTPRRLLSLQRDWQDARRNVVPSIASIERNRERAREWARNNPERNRARVQKWREENPARRQESDSARYLQAPDKYRERGLQRRYGLTSNEFDALAEKQGGKCAICAGVEQVQRKRRLSVDHDHDTGEVRGLLCSRCNSALGLFQDRLDILEAAAAYLRRAA